MVLGKSLILALTISTASYADTMWNPKFYEYSSNGIIPRIVEFGFGWNKKLDHQSIIHALEYAENGGKVKWYLNDASGYSVPVVTWPVSDGYCRRLHLSVIAHGKHKTKAVSACFSNMDSNWTWHRE